MNMGRTGEHFMPPHPNMNFAAYVQNEDSAIRARYRACPAQYSMPALVKYVAMYYYEINEVK